MKNLNLLLIVFSFFISIKLSAQSLSDFTLMSEEFPPYNYRENSIPKGVSIDIIKLLIAKTHSKNKVSEITFYPWARSYQLVLTKPNTALFVMTRTPKREHLFKWVGPISESRNVLIGKKGIVINVNDKNEFLKKSYCVVKNDAAEQLLLSHFKLTDDKINFAPDAKSCVHMLEAKRVDFFAYDINVTKWLLLNEGYDPAKYDEYFLLGTGKHYFGFNKETSDKLIIELQKHLDELKKDGSIQRIHKEYLF